VTPEARSIGRCEFSSAIETMVTPRNPRRGFLGLAIVNWGRGAVETVVRVVIRVADYYLPANVNSE